MLKVVTIVHPDVETPSAIALTTAAHAAGLYDARCVVPRGTLLRDMPKGTLLRDVPRGTLLRDMPKGTLLSDMPEVTPHGDVQDPEGADSLVHQLTVKGRGRTAHYAGLPSLLRKLRPDVIHVQASPASLVALQAMVLSRLLPKAALVLDAGHHVPPTMFWPSNFIRKRVLATAAGAIAPHHHSVRMLAKAGLRGKGFVAGPFAASVTVTAAERLAARQALGGPREGMLVVGAWGARRPEDGIFDVLEGVVASQRRAVLLVHDAGKLRLDLSDRAAALGASDRLVVLDETSSDPDAFLAALDCLAVLPKRGHSAAGPFDRRIAHALAHGIPVLASRTSGLAELVGAGGWMLDSGDPGQLAGVLRQLADEPAQVARAAEAARAEAFRRYSVTAVMEGFVEAFEAGHAARRARSNRLRTGVALAPRRGERA